MILVTATPPPAMKNGRSVPWQAALVFGNLFAELLVGLMKVSDAHHMLYLKHATQPKWTKSRFCLYGFME